MGFPFPPHVFDRKGKCYEKKKRFFLLRFRQVQAVEVLLVLLSLSSSEFARF